MLYTSDYRKWTKKGDDKMKLTNATEKAIAVVAMLSTQADNKLIPSSVIVERLNISDSYTKKLLRKLVVGGVIESVPGSAGGFRLACELNQINTLQIVEAIEGEVVTYPGYGTLAHTFGEFPESIEYGEEVISQVFANADCLWRDNLRMQTLDKIFFNAFGEREVSVDWMELKNKSK